MAESQCVQLLKNQSSGLYWCLGMTFMDVNLFSQNLASYFEKKGELTTVNHQMFPGITLITFPAYRQSCKPDSSTQQAQRTFTSSFHHCAD